MASQRQDRTHKGGAVLWYLRKHAPMPHSFGLNGVDPKLASASSSANVASTGDATATSSSPDKCNGTAQKAFLHKTLMAIGTELDEGQASKTPRSARHRENLRKAYATHTDNECEELRKAVKAKQEEVASLKRQVQQMERYVEATRKAAERRKSRLRTGTGSDGNTDSFSVAAVSGALKAKRHLLSTAGSTVWDADSPVAKGKSLDAVEELHQSLVKAMQEDQAMRAQVDEQMRALDQQTIRRRAAEAGLFNTHADILRLRAQTLQQEARVTRLANELRRVYKHLSRVVQQRLAQSADARAELTKTELASLQEQHRQEHFKFMGCDELLAEHDVVEDQLTDVTLHERDVVKTLESGDAVVKGSLEDMVTVRLALASLNEAWAKFAVDSASQGMRGSGRGSVRKQTVPQAGTSASEAVESQEDIQVLMHQASLEAAAIEELIFQMQRQSPDSDNDDTSDNTGTPQVSRPGSSMEMMREAMSGQNRAGGRLETNNKAGRKTIGGRDSPLDVPYESNEFPMTGTKTG